MDAPVDSTPDALATALGHASEWHFDATDLAPVRAQLGELAHLAGFRLVRSAPVDLTDSYVDTPSGHLARAGLALRLRSDGVHGEATLESLRDTGASPDEHRVISQPLEEADIESLLAAAGPVAERARAVADGEALQTLFIAHTHRDVFQAMHGDADAAEITLDDSRVSAEGDAPVTVMQRVEVKLRDASAAVVQPLVDVLCQTAALEPASLSRFEAGLQAVGRALPAPAHASVRIEPDMPAVAAGQLLLRDQLAAWRALEPAVRVGRDPEALHQLRVTGRRIIAMLRILEAAPLGGAVRLRRRVQALVQGSSRARDLDVQVLEFAAVGRTAAEHELRPLLDRLAQRRAARQAALLRLLDAPRTAQLFTALDALAHAPPPRRRARSAAAVAETLIRRRYRQVRRAAKLVAGDASTAHCHQLRLEAKKLRYVVEPFATLYGEPVRGFLRRLQKLQSLLGCINDAAHAINTLETEARRPHRGVPLSAVFAMGRVTEQQHVRLLAARERLRSDWRRVGGRRWRRLRARISEVSASLPSTRGN